jgi:aryl-alcohol dehydrogenase-like predicted oxidoreductase
VLPTVRELGIGYVAYSPLGRGFLTGQIKSPDDFPDDDFRRFHPRFTGENFEKNIALVHEIEAMAAEKGCTPRSSRSPGCWRRARTSCRSPAPSGAISTRISARST